MRVLAWAVLLALAGCGPAWAPIDAPTTPCALIDEATYQAARAAGAAHARASIHRDGSVSIVNGPGVVQCATFSSAMRPCRRPVDFVIEYRQPGGEIFYVHVPARAEYRFNVHAAPNTCQITRAPS